MTPEPLDDYLARLERALRHHGLDDPRTLAEAREHLVDAVADARRRGLTVDEAFHDAIERFGAPRIVAAHMAEAEDSMTNRLSVVMGTVWYRKWWILVPTLVTAIATSVLSYHFLPTRYRSETAIIIAAPRVPTEYVSQPARDRSQGQFEQVTAQIMSRTRLERIIKDFDLYKVERAQLSIDDVVLRMRRDIGLVLVGADSPREGEVRGFNLSFVSSDPTTAMRITERLATLFIEENLRDREAWVEGNRQFLDAQIEDMQRRIVGTEKTLASLRTQQGVRPLSQADLLPYEVLQERYKALLGAREDAIIVSNLERRQIGEQYKLLDAPRLPERPVGPSRLAVNATGALAGLGLGLVLVATRGRSTQAASS